MLGSDDQVDRLAEYADSGVRVLHRRGSLVGVPGRRGFNLWLYERWGNRGNAVYTFLGSLLVIALAGGCAAAFHEPLLFPSLGATAFLLFETPTAEVASPRNAMIGHTVAALAAAASLAIFGLLDAPDAIDAGVTAERAAAVALAVGLTGGILRLLRAAHPPAGATTIIVSIGLLTSAAELLTIVIAVAIVAGAGVLLNRVFGVPAPLWAAPR